MRRTRTKKENIQPINEGVYDFYDVYDQTGKNTAEKIVNYYIDKIRKYGKDSLTSEEKELFDNATKGNLTLDKPVYKRNKVTGDVELDNSGNPIRLDKDEPLPGIPFVTSKGRGNKRKDVINARCYWNIDDDHKMFFVYGGSSSDENPRGIIEWKTKSKNDEREFGAFIKPKSSDLSLEPEELWKHLDNKYDTGVILDKENLLMFLEFDKLYHEGRKANYERLKELYNHLSNYPKK